MAESHPHGSGVVLATFRMHSARLGLNPSKTRLNLLAWSTTETEFLSLRQAHAAVGSDLLLGVWVGAAECADAM